MGGLFTVLFILSIVTSGALGPNLGEDSCFSMESSKIKIRKKVKALNSFYSHRGLNFALVVDPDNFIKYCITITFTPPTTTDSYGTPQTQTSDETPLVPYSDSIEPVHVLSQ